MPSAIFKRICNNFHAFSYNKNSGVAAFHKIVLRFYWHKYCLIFDNIEAGQVRACPDNGAQLRLIVDNPFKFFDIFMRVYYLLVIC